LYVHSGGIYVAIARALTAVPGHALLGVLMGYFLYIYSIKNRTKQPPTKVGGFNLMD